MSSAPVSRFAQGAETRRNILRAAVDHASKRGLNALSIGDLAKELDMSKSGLFAHFGSKEDLQIATIEAAEKMFGETIIHPACEASPGIARLAALLERYVQYLEHSVFPGGCFFSAVAAEFDDRPGRVRDRIAESMRTWSDIIERQVADAIALGELLTATDPKQLAYELQGLTHHANFARRLMDDAGAFHRARTAIRDRLQGAATPHGRAILLTIKP